MLVVWRGCGGGGCAGLTMIAGGGFPPLESRSTKGAEWWVFFRRRESRRQHTFRFESGRRSQTRRPCLASAFPVCIVPPPPPPPATRHENGSPAQAGGARRGVPVEPPAESGALCAQAAPLPPPAPAPPPPRAAPLFTEAELVDVASLPPAVAGTRAALEALTSFQGVYTDLDTLTEQLETLTVSWEGLEWVLRHGDVCATANGGEEGREAPPAREGQRHAGGGSLAPLGRRRPCKQPRGAPLAHPQSLHSPSPSPQGEDVQKVNAAREAHLAARDAREARRKAKRAAKRAAAAAAAAAAATPAATSPASARRGPASRKRLPPAVRLAAPAAASEAEERVVSTRALSSATSSTSGSAARATAAARGSRRGGAAWGKRGTAAAAAPAFAGVVSTTAVDKPKKGAAAKNTDKKEDEEGAPTTTTPITTGTGGDDEAGFKRLAPLSRSINRNALLDADGERRLAIAVQSGLALEAVRAQMVAVGGVGAAPPTPAAWAAAAGVSQAELAARLRRSRAARERMVACNTRLVISIARRYVGRGLELEDLVQEGVAGLLKGVEKFDPSRGFKFSTYAHWWIRQAVTRAISEHGRVVRLPVHLHEQMARLLKAEKALTIALGRKPTPEEAAAAASMPSAEKVTALKNLYAASTSMEEVVPGSAEGEGGPVEAGDAIEDETLPDAAATATMKSLMRDLDGVLATLGARERGVLRMRYGLDDGRAKTLEEIGTAYSVTRERIRQIEAKALLKLRQPARAAALVDYAGEGAGVAAGWKQASTKAR